MYLLFDVGGTKTRIAVSKYGKSLNSTKIIPTPKNAEQGIRIIAGIAKEFAQGEKIKAAAGGFAGTLDQNKTKLFGARNLPGWVGKPLAQTLQKTLGAPVFLENDAALAGLGEATVGVGKGSKILAYLTVSTGVGGARIVSGRIDEKTFGFEPGQQIIEGGHTLEWFISGKELEKRLGKQTREIKDSPTKEKLARYLAIGVNNIIVHWSPDVIVLGGSVMNIISLARVRFYLKKVFKTRAVRPPVIKRAVLGDLSGLHGALIYLKQMMGA